MPSRADQGAALPSFGAGSYLWDALMGLGPVRAHPKGGRRAVDWPEIGPFAAVMGPFERWELRLLREMACAYLDGLSIGEDPMGRLD